MSRTISYLNTRLYNFLLSVPVRIKIAGIALLPVLILGLALNYWVTTGLSDWLSYLLTDVRVEAAMRAGGRSVFLVTFLAASGSLALAWMLTFIFTRPLLDVREMARRVAGGELETRAPIWANDEIGEVAHAINTMTDHLVQAHDRLARSNRRLDALNQVIMAADRDMEIHDILYAMLEATVTVLNLETGWVYLRDPERDVFHLASWYNVPEEVQPHLLRQTEGQDCSCQAVAVDGTQDTEVKVRVCRRLEQVALPGIPTKHISMPIEARGENFGVMNLHWANSRTLTAEDIDILTSISTQVGEIVASAWLRLKLAEKEVARQFLLESLVEAQEEERSRLARELHDGAGQMLTNLLVRLKTVERGAESPATRTQLGAILDTMSHTIEQVRDLSYSLRPVALEEFGLCVALETLLEEMLMDTALTARYDLDLEEGRLSPSIETTLYRIAQEALTNVVRHADAQMVTIALHGDRHRVLLRIEDDGVGFAPSEVPATGGRRHLGLISMQERAAMIGAAFDLYSAPAAGTTVEVRLPLTEHIYA